MSYMLVGPCVCGVHSVLLEGSFAYPDPLRFARAALEHKVTLFKTGSEGDALGDEAQTPFSLR